MNDAHLHAIEFMRERARLSRNAPATHKFALMRRSGWGYACANIFCHNAVHCRGVKAKRDEYDTCATAVSARRLSKTYTQSSGSMRRGLVLLVIATLYVRTCYGKTNWMGIHLSYRNSQHNALANAISGRYVAPTGERTTIIANCSAPLGLIVSFHCRSLLHACRFSSSARRLFRHMLSATVLSDILTTNLR